MLVRDAAQPMAPHRAPRDPIGIADGIAQRPRREDLRAVAHCRDARDGVHRDTDISGDGEGGLAEMQADPDADAASIGPRMRPEGPLHADRGIQRLGWIGECREELVAARIDLVAATSPCRGAQEPPNVSEQTLVAIRELGEVPGRVLDVGQQEGDAPGRQPALRPQLPVDEAHRHEAIPLRCLEQARARPIPRPLVVECDATEACQRVADVRFVVDWQEPPAVRVDVGERAVRQTGPRLGT